MEGLIPFVLKALKKNKLHKSLSDGSRRSYHLLLAGGGDSHSGSSHRRTQSEFQPPSSMSFRESSQPEPEEVFVRCGSLNGDVRVPDPDTGNRVWQTRTRGNEIPGRVAHRKWY